MESAALGCHHEILVPRVNQRILNRLEHFRNAEAPLSEARTIFMMVLVVSHAGSTWGQRLGFYLERDRNEGAISPFGCSGTTAEWVDFAPPCTRTAPVRSAFWASSRLTAAAGGRGGGTEAKDTGAAGKITDDALLA
jgi:hypothetical protein